MSRVVMGVLLTAILIVESAANVQAEPLAHAIEGVSLKSVVTSVPPEVVTRVAASLVEVQPVDAGTPSGAGAAQPARVGLGLATAGGTLASDHIVRDANQAQVLTSAGQRLTSQVVWRSPSRDLVMLQNDSSLPPADLEPASRLVTNEPVVIVGYRVAQPGQAMSLALSYGRVAAVQQDQEGITSVLTTARFDSSTSGGVLVDRQGHVVGGPSLSADDSTGMTIAIASEELLSLLNRPPQPTVETGKYAGDGRDILPTSVQLGPAWRAAPVPANTPAGPAAGGVPPATERLVYSDPNATSGSFAEVWPVVTVASDAQHAQWAWERGLRRPPLGVTRLPDPTPSCHAYEQPDVDGTHVRLEVVACREANVALGVALIGTPDLATSETAVRVSTQMTERVRAAAR